MVEKKIHVNSLDEARMLVNNTMLCDFDIDLVSGRYVVDAKSIMGVFSLERDRPVILRADCREDDPFFEKIASLIVE